MGRESDRQRYETDEEIREQKAGTPPEIEPRQQRSSQGGNRPPKTSSGHVRDDDFAASETVDDDSEPGG